MVSPLSYQWSHNLHKAASDGDTTTLRHLLEEGHPPDIRGGQVCWLRGASETHTRTPLHYSAKEGQLDCIRLLLKFGGNPNASDSDGYTPIHYVCQIHNPGHDNLRVWQCLVSLIEFGGNFRTRTKSGHTPLDLAKQQKNSVCVSELLKQGMQPKPLLVLSRHVVSTMIHMTLLEPAHKLWIPASLQRYLVFEDIVDKWKQ